MFGTKRAITVFTALLFVCLLLFCLELPPTPHYEVIFAGPLFCLGMVLEPRHRCRHNRVLLVAKLFQR